MAKNKDAIAFLHDANARNDLKIAPLRQNFGAEGYGIFWMIIEILREQTNFKIKLSDLDGLNCQLQPHNLDFEKFLEFCLEKCLLKKDKNYLWSDSLLRRMKSFTDARKRMSEGGKKAMNKRYKHLRGTLQEPCKVNQTKTKQVETNTNQNQIETKAKQILAELNSVTGCNYTDTQLIIQNLLEGKSFEDHIKIIEIKKQDPDFIKNPAWMKPSTLFGNKFDEYRNQRVEMFNKQKYIEKTPPGNPPKMTKEEMREYYKVEK